MDQADAFCVDPGKQPRNYHRLPDESDHQAMTLSTFLGPYRGVHTMDMVGSSAWIPLPAFAAWRACAATYLISTVAVFAAVDNQFSLKYFTNLSYTLLAATFLVLATLSLLHLLRRGAHWTAVPGITTTCYHITASAAFFLDVVYWALLRGDNVAHFRNVSIHALNSVLVFLDFALGARAQFRVLDVVYVMLYPLVWTFLFAWPWWAARGEWIYGFLDYEKNGVGYTVGLYLGLTALGAVTGILFVAVSRLWTLCKCAGGGGGDGAAGEGPVEEPDSDPEDGQKGDV